MRTRKEIETFEFIRSLAGSERVNDPNAWKRLEAILEVLLDIRELLEEKTINVYVTNAHEI